MVIVDRQVIRHSLAAEHTERVDAAERDDTLDACVARGLQHVPIARHVVRDEALAGIGGIRLLPTCGVDDRVASTGGCRIVIRVQNVVAFGNVKSDDLIAVMSAGAYGFVMASNYNSRGLAAEALVHGHKAALVRERQQLEEIWESEKVPAWLR